MSSFPDIESLSWPSAPSGEESLLPLVAQSALTGQVLMVGYVNRVSLEATLRSGEVTFWSRSRQKLWRKGEESGHVLTLEALHVDCDADTLLALVTPQGPTCHRQTTTCFDTLEGASFQEVVPAGARLAKLFGTLQDISKIPPSTPEADLTNPSYTRRLLAAGLDRCLRKLGEETTECVIAAKTLQATPASKSARADLASEAADVLYHLFATLVVAGVPLTDVTEALASREGKRRPDATLASKI
ncbi:MAG: bifunctional phosphoribosyl-AMP cyclohydrolase/phosphoribosyl-ATP diphosphatase HisIE [Silvanigrellales bacterium]|jgi:phosphoribosyl-ATP pyrophosphohydrolase/phosphoribosyl-AMP cyclohydrolase|nr:bifunctional phosphoribosyl-AMP cyclohydrolase/phosphoribosyl-ATP diphosphatase HisIE [Silvanigrellales bacterium]